jgi:ATP-binding cassette subfamily B protein
MTATKTLWRYAARYKIKLGFSLACIVGANLLKGAGPAILQQAVDHLSNGITQTVLLRYSLLLTSIALLQGAFRFAQEQSLLGTSCCIERDLRSVFFEHLQKLPAHRLQTSSTGNLMALASNDLPSAVTGASHALLFSIDAICGLLIILPLMLHLSVLLTFLAFAPLVLVLIASLLLRKKLRARFDQVQEHFGTLADRAQSALLGMRIIRAFTRERAVIEGFRHINIQYSHHNLRRARLAGLLFPLLQFFIGLSAIAVLWYGGDLAASGRLSIGQFLQFILYLGYLAWPMHVLGTQIALFEQGMAAMARVQSLLSSPAEAQISPPSANLSTLAGQVEFREVTFRYEGTDRAALDRISFCIRPGQRIGLVGPVGAGKSTLLNMIAGLLEPCSGAILIDGQSIEQISVSTLRSAIGYVPQESFLFSDTIAGNIAFGQKEASQQEIEWAANLAGLAHDIADLPAGYQTMVGERGTLLSGGQKQRISIARAVLRRPPLLLLDDPFSSVDLHTEELILENLRDFMERRTCLICSHRVSAVRDADLVLVLREGRIIEQGTHNQLVAGSGFYSEMCAAQLLERDLAVS